jgi:UDP-GlcNAc:undecaprenyl-phosphate GlcNAc-1-phosphate transferase
MPTTLPLWFALILSLLLIPIVKRIGFRVRLVAAPRADRWHTKLTPKVGGVAIFLASALALLATSLIRLAEQTQWALLVGSVLMFLLGLYDDFKHISPPAKLVGQIIAAAIVVFFGRNIEFFSLEILNIIFTFAWLVGITNAINLLDNMDGLAGGVALISAGMMSYLFWRAGTFDLTLISLALAGGIAGFLFFNFPPASIFMGDSGSLFIGFTLAALAIARVPRASNLLAVMGVPILIFLLPILDTTFVTITRILRGQSPTHGGKDHTSHRLIAFGLTERQAVLTLYGVALVSGIAATVLESLDYTISLVLFPVLLLALTLLTAYLGRIKVIDPDTPQPTRGTITRLMVGLTVRGRIWEVAFDLLLISVSYYLAFWIYYGSDADIVSMDIFLRSIPIALSGTYLSFFVFGIYRGVWQYISFRDLTRYGTAVLGSGVLIAITTKLMYPESPYPLTVFALFIIFLFLGLAVSRSSFRVMDQFYSEQTRDPQQAARVLIYRADDAGVMALQWMLQDPHSPYRIVGFLDNDPYRRGRQIQGISVLGSLEEIETIVEKYSIEGIVIASEDTLRGPQAKPVLDLIRARGVWMKRMRIDFETVE